MFQVDSDPDALQAALDVLNMQKFRELSARALNVGQVLVISLEDVRDYEGEEDLAEGGLGRFSLPMQERLDATESLIAADEALQRLGLL